MRSNCAELDGLTVTELEAVEAAVIAIDGDGRVVAVSAGAARWARVAAWRVRGRAIEDELAWLFGAAAARRIGEIARSAAPAEVVRAEGRRREAITLRRGAERIYVAPAGPGAA